jgi:hypothetical protein
LIAHRKLTADQIKWAKEVIAKRRDVLRQLSMYPTLAKLAEHLEVSPRYLSEVVNNRARTECSTGNILTQELCL